MLLKKGSTILDIEMQEKGSLDNPKGIAKDVSTIGHQGDGDYQIQIENDNDLEYIMSLIKQVIN